jgi:hypothetical protein
VPPFLVLVANVLVTLILVTVGATAFLSPRLSRTSASLAVLPLVDAALLVGFVFGEDSYRDNGISRWDAYRSGGALGPMFVVSLALLIACAALLVYAGRRGRRQLFASTACLSGITALFLVTATVIGFSAN